jgi:hypothetical protein
LPLGLILYALCFLFYTFCQDAIAKQSHFSMVIVFVHPKAPPKHQNHGDCELEQREREGRNRLVSTIPNLSDRLAHPVYRCSHVVSSIKPIDGNPLSDAVFLIRDIALAKHVLELEKAMEETMPSDK